MISLFLAAARCDSIEKPPITINTPTVTVSDHSVRTFRTVALAKPYIKSIIADSTAAEKLAKQIQFTKRVSIDLNTMGGDPGNQIDRTFTRTHTIFCMAKTDDGQIKIDFSNVNIACNVHAEQILVQTKTKKKLFGLIKKTTRTRLTQWRPLTADELSSIYNTMNNAAASHVSQAVQKVKSI